MSKKLKKQISRRFRRVSAAFNCLRVLYNPLFDVDWYGGAYLGSKSKVRCAYHYLTHWNKNNAPFNPSLKFSTSIYLRDHPETKECPLLLTKERNIGEDQVYKFKAPDLSLIRTEPLKEEVFEHAVVLPLKSDNRFWGSSGIIDAQGHAHTIYSEKNNFPLATKIEGELLQDDGDVYWGGPLCWHWGHFLVEFASTLWPLLKYNEIPESVRIVYSVSYIPNEGSVYYSHYRSINEFFKLFGLKDGQVCWLTQPTQFKRVHMVEPASRLASSVTPIYREIFNRVARDIPPAKYEKVYFTRSQGGRYISVREDGEHQLEDAFKKLGYAVLAPEHLSLRDQIAVVKGAKEYACLSSTLLHHVLFMQPGSKLICCEKFDAQNPYQPYLEAVSQVSSLSLKAYIQFLPVSEGSGPCIVGITEDVQRYFASYGIHLKRQKRITRKQKIWYLRQWLATYDPMNANLFDLSFGKMLSPRQLDYLRDFIKYS